MHLHEFASKQNVEKMLFNEDSIYLQTGKNDVQTQIMLLLSSIFEHQFRWI